jgi:hypothetical protein
VTWLRNHLLGVFTRHLGAKLLALLLSVGLFGFVQASLRGTQPIRQLKLRLTLAQELKDQYVLLPDDTRRRIADSVDVKQDGEAVVLTFGGLAITGMRAKVDPMARLYRRDAVNPLAIDQRFLNVYGEDYREGGKRIRIDRDLFADDALFGKDIVVDGLPDDVAVTLDRIEERTARVEVAPEMPTAIGKPNHEFEGRIALTFNVKSVRIDGPASAFTAPEPVAQVSVKDIEDELSKVQIQGERGTARLSPDEIRWKGVATDLLPLLRIRANEMGGDPMSVREFQQRLVASCEVTRRKRPKSLPEVPIEIRYLLPPPFDLVKDWEVFTVFVDRDLQEGRMQHLGVRLPASLAENPDFLGNLVVVLNVAAAKADPTTPDLMFVPFYLDLKDRSRKEDVAGLALVEIDPATIPDPVAQFRKRTK